MLVPLAAADEGACLTARAGDGKPLSFVERRLRGGASLLGRWPDQE